MCISWTWAVWMLGHWFGLFFKFQVPQSHFCVVLVMCYVCLQHCLKASYCNKMISVIQFVRFLCLNAVITDASDISSVLIFCFSSSCCINVLKSLLTLCKKTIPCTSCNRDSHSQLLWRSVKDSRWESLSCHLHASEHLPTNQNIRGGFADQTEP